LKALVLIGVNVYYVSDWLVKRGRYYHSYWNPDEYNEETYFIIQGSIELVVQLVLAIGFCIFNGLFTYKVRDKVCCSYLGTLVTIRVLETILLPKYLNKKYFLV